MLYYDEYGSKENPTIMLLHGAGALDTFCRQYCFSDKYHLIVPHLAGAGKAATEIYEPEKTVEELFALIKTLHKKRIGVIGKSQAENNSDVLFSCRFIRKNATLEMVSAISREILELHKKTSR